MPCSRSQVCHTVVTRRQADSWLLQTAILDPEADLDMTYCRTINKDYLLKPVAPVPLGWRWRV